MKQKAKTVEIKPSGIESPPSFYRALIKMMEAHKEEIIAAVEAEQKQLAHDGCAERT